MNYVQLEGLEKRIEQLEQLGHTQAVLIEDLRLENDTLRAQIAGLISREERSPVVAARLGRVFDEWLYVKPADEIVREIMAER